MENLSKRSDPSPPLGPRVRPLQSSSQKEHPPGSMSQHALGGSKLWFVWFAWRGYSVNRHIAVEAFDVDFKAPTIGNSRTYQSFTARLVLKHVAGSEFYQVAESSSCLNFLS